MLVMQERKKNSGFSLLELMVAVSITAILLTVGVPSFQSTMLRARGSAIADTLITAIYYARSEAISRNASIQLCASVNGTACNGAAANWNNGWIAIDTANNVLKVWTVDASVARVNFFDNLAAQDDQRLMYNSLGEASMRNAAGDDLSATIRLRTEVANCGAGQARDININSAGSLRVVANDC